MRKLEPGVSLEEFGEKEDLAAVSAVNTNSVVREVCIAEKGNFFTE